MRILLVLFVATLLATNAGATGIVENVITLCDHAVDNTLAVVSQTGQEATGFVDDTIDKLIGNSS